MKKQNPLWRLSVTTTLAAEDAVSELLATTLGTGAAAYFDLEKQTSLVSVFMEQGKLPPATRRKEIAAGLARLTACGLPVGAGKIEIARVKREDWSESWKRHFHPLEIGKMLLVKPSWSKKAPRKNQAVVILDPGLSFGTGQHPTTSFCLQQIVRCRNSGTPQSFLDIGTGSGILAIAAAKLGYTPVQAFDFDPESVRVARDNARKNRVEARVKPTRQDVTKLPLRPTRQFDLVCANLISTLLITEKRRIASRIKPAGTLVLAGILATEFAEVEQAFADLKMKLVAKQKEKQWGCTYW